MLPSFSAWMPRTTPISAKERFRSAVGALLGVLATGSLCRLAVGDGGTLPTLIAPIGASAVLLFAVPSSPLAQPWSILGGNVVAALVGVTAATLVPEPLVAAALAVGLAIGLMASLRCIHPPSGAVALTVVLGGPAVRHLGYGFVLWPVAANSVLLLAVALLFNNLLGRSYPHRPIGPAAERDARRPAPAAGLGFSSADIDAVLAENDQLLDVDRRDLEAILRQAEIRSYRRRAGLATCSAVMRRDAVAVAPGAPIAEALRLMRDRAADALPVTDERARVLGMVTRADLLDKPAWDRAGPRLGILRRLRLTVERGRAPQGNVEDIMTAPVARLFPEAPLADAVRLMASTGLHNLPVVGPDGRLIGLVSQPDLLVALLAETADSRRAGGSGAA